ncbi:7-cyano-7-deazaguanine synthase [Candidatus Micrarchaeota archaeon]|nr:7-cyano-7-deazaguanine synthase [Candidatus Micrarchaeota archaeon]
MIIDIAKLLQRSVEENLEDRIGIAFSGGIDSTLIAKVAKEHAEILLFSVGTKESQDLEYAEKIAAELGLKLHKSVLAEPDILEIYKKCQEIIPGDLLKVELMVPVYEVARMAKENGISVVLFGSGSEELFVGYDRYYRYLEERKDLDAILKDEFHTLKDRDIAMVKKVCYRIGVEAKFPFYNRELAELVFSIPLAERIADKELKKGVLREAAKILSVPELAINRRKKAMQYGSGVHKVLMKNLKK